MKVTKAEVSVIDIPLKEPWIMARVQINNVVALIIQLHTDEGLVGIGSARVGEGLTHENIEAMKSAAEIYIAPALIGCDPIDINDWTERLKRALRRGYTITKSGFEIALYDLIGKKMGRPLADVLGGTWHKEVGLVGGVSVGEPKAMAEKAVSLLSKGYTTLKLKIGKGTEVHKDEERVKAVRDAVGFSVPLRLDVNSVYNVPEMIRLLHRLEKYDPVLIEDPIESWDLDDWAFLSSKSNIPICADHPIMGPEEAFRFLSRRAAQIIKIKMSKVGGLNAAKRIIHVAEAAGVDVIVGRGATDNITMMAEVHLVASSKNVIPVGEMTGSVRLKDHEVKSPVPVVNGKVTVSSLPGLGLELDHEKLRKYKVQ
jgi:L-alanine-DL-glutamate epimerase-like enolase superfamily enzyme